MLSIFKNSSDISLLVDDYIGESYTGDLLTTETIDVGYFKPINALYFEIDTQAAENELVVEFWDGLSWAILNVKDKTFGLKKSGFVTWERNIENQADDLLHGKQLYWYRFSISSNDITGLKIKGINLVFSSDLDLKESYPDIMERLHDGETSFIAYHQSARNSILTYLRNKGKSIASFGVYKLLDQFDIHDYEEIKQASKYKALATIFFNESDNVDDKWYQKAKDFDVKYGESIDLNFLSLDLNNDGKVDASENQAVQYIKVQRL